MKRLNVAMKASVDQLNVNSLDWQGDKTKFISFDNSKLAKKSMLDVDRAIITPVVHFNLIKHMTRCDALNGIAKVEVWLSHDDKLCIPGW